VTILPDKKNEYRNKLIIEEYILGSLILVMVVFVFVQVLSRYIFHRSLSYTEEIVRYMFVWCSFLGIAAAVKRKHHLVISIFLEYLPHGKRWALILKNASIIILFWISVLFFLVLFWFGAQVVLLQIETGQKTAALGLPIWVVGIAAPVCSLAVLLRIFERCLKWLYEKGQRSEG